MNLRPSSGVTNCWNSRQRLLAEVVAVHQEEDALGAGVLDQAID